jgi:hypothetical protein
MEMEKGDADFPGPESGKECIQRIFMSVYPNGYFKRD